MRERDRIAIREYQVQVEKEEKEAEGRRLAPIRKAEAELQKTADELARIIRVNLLAAPDPDVYIDPRTVGKRVPLAQAQRLAVLAAEEFLKRNPDYYICPENFETIRQYFAINDCELLTAEMYEAAFVKLRNAGLIREAPEPEPEPEPINEPEQEQKPEQPSRNSTGYDLATGELREYTPWEVEQMTANEFRRVFGLRSSSYVLINPATRREATPQY
jgi:hypothetical protein